MRHALVGWRGARRAPAPRATRALLLLLALVLGCAHRQPLRVATSGDYPPFSAVAADGTRTGLDVAIATRLADDLDLELVWVPFAWPELHAATARGDFDVALSGVTMRADRALVGRYVRPYARTEAVLVVTPRDSRRTLAELDRPAARVAVNAGGHLERVARRALTQATIVPVADNRIVAALAGGGVDGVVTDTAELAAWPADAPQPRLLARLGLGHKAPLLPADRADLAARFDAWLRAREADGWLDGERVRALGPSAGLDAAGAAREAVAALIHLRLALMPDVAAAKRAAGLPVEDREQEARVLARVRSQVPSAPERGAAVYAELIEMAKAVQRAAPASAGDGPSLDALRAALARIDAALCVELDHLPPSSEPAWRAALAQTGAGPVEIDRLATALAS
jgi:cyclohexadienyl dehydratase